MNQQIPNRLILVNKQLTVHSELCRNNYLLLSLLSSRMASMASSQSKAEPDGPDDQLADVIKF